VTECGGVLGGSGMPTVYWTDWENAGVDDRRRRTNSLFMFVL